MPVPAQVGSVERNDHQVHGAREDVLVAAGAEVGLEGLVGLDPADLDLYGLNAHSRSNSVTARAAARKR